MQEVTRRKASRFIADLRPFFRAYMFVGVDVQAAPWDKINSTLSASRLVSFDGIPNPLPLKLVSSLMLRFEKKGKLLLPKVCRREAFS